MNRDNPTLDGSNVDRSMARLPVLFLVLGWRVLGFGLFIPPSSLTFSLRCGLTILLCRFFHLCGCHCSWRLQIATLHLGIQQKVSSVTLPKFTSRSWQAKLQIPQICCRLAGATSKLPPFRIGCANNMKPSVHSTSSPPPASTNPNPDHVWLRP